jgi:hypothetical protein
VHGSAIGLSLFLALVLIFAAAGIGLIWLGWKMRVEGRNQAVRRERYPDQPWRWREDWEQGFARSDGRGTARVQLNPSPGVLGGKLKGRVEAATPLTPGQPAALNLECTSWVPRGRGNSMLDILWQETASATVDGAGGIPVEFDLPFDGRATGSYGREQLSWRLTVSCAGSGFQAIFHVPVFRTAESDARRTAESLETRAGERLAPPDARRVERTTTPEGVTYRFPAGRNPGMAKALTVFGPIFLAGAVLMAPFGGGAWVGVAMAGIIGLILTYAALWLWFGVTTVTAAGRQLRVRNSCLGIASTKIVRADEIGQMQIKVGMQKGNTVWYDVNLHLSDGSTRDAGTGMEKPEAEWYIAALKKDLGVGGQ